MPEEGRLWELSKRATVLASPLIYPLLGIGVGISYYCNKIAQWNVISSLKERVIQAADEDRLLSYFDRPHNSNSIKLVFLNSIQSQKSIIYSDLIKFQFDNPASYQRSILLEKLKERFQIAQENLGKATFYIGQNIEIKSNLFIKVGENRYAELHSTSEVDYLALSSKGFMGFGGGICKKDLWALVGEFAKRIYGLWWGNLQKGLRTKIVQ